MLVNLPNPFSLDTTTDPLSLQPIKATDLQFADTQTRQGRVMRGRGMSRCKDIAGNASTAIACGVFTRKDCRRVVLVQYATGAVELEMGSPIGIAGFPCAGPLPEWQDLELEPGDQMVYINAQTPYNSASAVTVSVASGHTYQVDCVGIWGRDAPGTYDCDANGEADGGAIFLAPFLGSNYGVVFAREPGNANSIELAAGWKSIGKSGTVFATATGNMKLVFADINDTAYSNNSGYMAARVRDIT